jgi:conjugal transfer pilin signal peptidase TrbI
MVRKKKPWKVFALQCLIVAACVWGVMAVAMERYRIGIDPQLTTCVPGKRVFAVDLNDQRIERGHLVAFRAQGLDPFFPDGTQMIKFAMGMPGDRVVVGNPLITVEGRQEGWGLILAKNLGVPEKLFERELIVPEGHIWVMGKTHDSFDSRYWGVVPMDRVIGRAYAIF